MCLPPPLSIPIPMVSLSSIKIHFNRHHTSRLTPILASLPKRIHNVLIPMTCPATDQTISLPSWSKNLKKKNYKISSSSLTLSLVNLYGLHTISSISSNIHHRYSILPKWGYMITTEQVYMYGISYGHWCTHIKWVIGRCSHVHIHNKIIPADSDKVLEYTTWCKSWYK